MVQEAVSSDNLAPAPNISHIVIEDDTPVDNFRSEKQQRLLTEVLYTSWNNPTGSERFIVAANVGVFYSIGLPPLVPDVFLSLDVTMPDDWREKKNRTYFTWEFGKAPDVVIEIVSNREGNELSSKLQDYARMGVGYYAVFDPLQLLGDCILHTYQLTVRHYIGMETSWLAEVCLGLTLWEGVFEGKQDIWLRLCDHDGNILLTGAERAQAAEQRALVAEERAQTAELRAEQLAAQLRALGIDPD
ncbi:Uma2 family endonuclease [Nostoc sp. LEGE 06077]|uniref:Uma2 family endonuclease n=1 Tax=Nostoc sp. LEGE 06077 TaxID=915325 RepID=UPI001882B1BB|nr:Uma2 family endonuclease [Nostoc sp. LEGE 06077]MBE9210708.1 Uma2 family endonuclease [Nostoc sp. LEGE 06077]